MVARSYKSRTVSWRHTTAASPPKGRGSSSPRTFATDFESGVASVVKLAATVPEEIS